MNLTSNVKTPAESAKTIKQLRLSDMAQTRKSIARIIRYLQACPENELARYRLINAYLNTLVTAHRYDVDDRLHELEQSFYEITKQS